MDNKIEEVELCRREISHRASPKWIFIGLGYFAFSFIVNFVLGVIIDGDMFSCFRYGGLYFIGFGNAFLGLMIAIIAFIIWAYSNYTGEIVLTNKRLIVRYTLKRLIAGTIVLENDYVLNHIVDFAFTEFKRNNSFNFSFSTTREKVQLFISDREFYDCFVDSLK